MAKCSKVQGTNHVGQHLDTMTLRLPCCWLVLKTLINNGIVGHHYGVP
jgi:hypothetical protein